VQYYQAKSEDTETEYKLTMSNTISLFRKMASTRCHSDTHGKLLRVRCPYAIFVLW
jgi:hypothetical protein